jgi:hypothetical protein
MKLTVVRKEFSETTTIGEMFVDGVFQCYTLEDTVRNLKSAKDKIYGKTAIPAGTYKVTITDSARFKRKLPLVNDVPFFEGIRIHPGNTAADTDGCILVGTSKLSAVDRPTLFIGNSRVAFEALFAKLVTAGSISITITEDRNATAP